MKKLKNSLFLAILTTLFGIALVSAPANAQSGSLVRVDIPFDFSVGDATLKAGSYTVREEQAGVLAFSGDDGKEHQFVLTVRGDAANDGQQPHFVFTRYGSETFLSRVFLSDENDCQQLPRSGREKQIIKSRTSGEELSLLIELAH